MPCSRPIRTAQIGVALAALAFPAMAQDADSASTVEDIVVIGTRQDTRLADAPIAATVLTQQFIDDARITTLRQIDDFVPNVQFNQLGQVGGTFVTIRGIESNPFIVNRAAVYVDGVPFRKVRDQALGQVQQIEVLRGPQGTLYGANTESGLIVVQTRQPSETFEGEVETSLYDFDGGDGASGALHLGGPLVPGYLTGSLSASYEDADSFVRNVASSIGEPGEVRETYLQGKLRWTPNERTSVNAVAVFADLTAPGLYEQEFLPIDRAVYDANYAALNEGRASGPYTLINDAPKRTEEDERVVGVSLNQRFDGVVFDANASWRRLVSDSAGTDIDLPPCRRRPGRAATKRRSSTWKPGCRRRVGRARPGWWASITTARRRARSWPRWSDPEAWTTMRPLRPSSPTAATMRCSVRSRFRWATESG